MSRCSSAALEPSGRATTTPRWSPHGGREYRPVGYPEQVNVHDFHKELGKAIPYGIYDVSDNSGWVSVGVDHDTSAFAVATLRTWWETSGGPATRPRTGC